MTIGDTKILQLQAMMRSATTLTGAWRAATALVNLAAVGGKTIPVQDPDVRRLARHLTPRKVYSTVVTPKPDAFDRVIGWHENGTGPLVESFIIACGTDEEAAAELGIVSSDVRLYKSLFFDIPDSNAANRRAVIMRLQNDLNALEVLDAAAKLRKVALASGIHGLRRFLHAEQSRAETGEPTLDELVENELKRRLVEGELRTGDLVRLQSNAITRSRLIREEDGDGKQMLRENIRVMQSILGMVAPHMVDPGRTMEEKQSTDEAIRARLDSQRNIGSTPSNDDKDMGIEALNKLMSRNFSARPEPA